MAADSNHSGNLGMHHGARAKIFQNAKSLRWDMTKAEVGLWERLRKKQLKGYRFRRQHPVAKYIVDFYCHALKLVIEVDGGYHRDPEQQELDLARTKALEDVGLMVIRFSNEEVFKEIDLVIARIMSVVEEREEKLRIEQKNDWL